MYFSIVCSIVVLFGYLYANIDNIFISRVSLRLLYISSVIWGCILLKYYGIGVIKILFIRKSYSSLPDIPEFKQFSKIAKDMEVKLNKKQPFVLKKGLNNAAFRSWTNQLIFGDVLFDKLDTHERLALFYHEITHVKKLGRYILKYALVLLSALISTAFILRGEPDHISALVCISLFFAVFPYISRRFEYEADYGALQGTTVETARSLLEKSEKRNRWDRETITHPSILSRIAKLESYQAKVAKDK